MTPTPVHIVSHTHWDREWYLTREQFRLRLVGLIDRALRLLEADPRFRCFHLDGQTIVVEDYLEIRPEQAERLTAHVTSGRVLVGPWYVMPDEFLVSGESLVRNFAIGHRIAARCGAVMPVGYLPDLFGHVAQMPQILTGLGLDNAILWRGFGGQRAEYWWEGLDGSRVLMVHLPPEGYCNAVRVLLVANAMLDRARAAIERERARSRVGQVLLMSGVDHVEPHPALPDLAARLSELPGIRARISSLPEYVEAVRSAVRSRDGDELDVIRGELRRGEDYAPLLPGILSARLYLKRANARVQTLLERWAEPASLYAWLLNGEYPAGALAYAWKTLIQNHAHDSICGCSIDAVHEENMTRFARAGQVAEALADRALSSVARAVAPPPPGAVRGVVINSDATVVRGVVEGVINLHLESAEPWRTVDAEALDEPVRFFPRDTTVTGVRDPSGQPVPFQILSAEDALVHVMSRYETPWAIHARRLRVVWWADEVPPCGYAAYDLPLGDAVAERLAPAPRGAAAAPGELVVGERSAENAFVRITVRDDGTVDVEDKGTGGLLRGCGALEDVGDVGDEYTYCPPASDRRVTNADARPARITRIDHGPLRATFRIELSLPLPGAAVPDRTRRGDELVSLPVTLLVSLDAGSSRVTWSATIENTARDHRLRAVFPIGATAQEVRVETAFAVLTRPARRAVGGTPRVEAPVNAQPFVSFVDVGDAHRGVTLFAHGLTEYEVTADRQHVELTIVRAVGDLSRGDLGTRPAGHAGPALPTPGAQCLGRHEVRFAIEPRATPPPEATLVCCAHAFVAPPRVVGAQGAGRLPPRFSFLRVEGAVALSALKKAADRDSVVLRVFNPGGTEARATITACVPIAQAFALDLLERRQSGLPVADGRVAVALPAFRIQTIELVPAGQIDPSTAISA